MKVNSKFPCQSNVFNFWKEENKAKVKNVHENGALQCELYQDRYVIIPIEDKDSHCTAVFDTNAKKWTKLQYDSRYGNGTLIKTKDKDKILFLGRESRSIWELKGIDEGWQMIEDVKIPRNVAENATKIIALHPEFCNNK